MLTVSHVASGDHPRGVPGRHVAAPPWGHVARYRHPARGYVAQFNCHCPYRIVLTAQRLPPRRTLIWIRSSALYVKTTEWVEYHSNETRLNRFCSHPLYRFMCYSDYLHSSIIITTRITERGRDKLIMIMALANLYYNRGVELCFILDVGVSGTSALIYSIPPLHRSQ